MRRSVYCVLGAHSLPYAERCLVSLFDNVLDDIELTIVSDAPEDTQAIVDALTPHLEGRPHRLRAFSKPDCDTRAASYYAGFPEIQRFREGHPCWRKVTDPPMFAEAGQEVIVIDPDVYFPNRFRFEPTPASGVLLMWQRPNCLLPEDVVRRAFEANVAMADHTDIGVCQFRAPLPLRALEDLLAKLWTGPVARSMHVESIVWAALAMEMGGGYLDPKAWHCFSNSVLGRVRRRFGESGADSLKRLDISAIKAFHAGGIAKYWLADAERAGILARAEATPDTTPVKPYQGYPRAKFEAKFRNRRLARRLGLYRLMGDG